MDEQPRSNRPTPRTQAAIEAELRRRLRSELTQARADADGELDDAALAEIIAHAIGEALGWHLESPEHTRNSTLSSRTWRGAGGPRGGQPRDAQGDRDFGPGGRDFGPDPRDFEPRPPRNFGGRGGGFGQPRRGPGPPYPPRDREPGYEERFGDDEPFPPRPRGPRPPGPRPPFQGPRSGGGGGGGGRRPPPRKGGGFGPRKPRRGG